jgi:hypothetical protein
MNIWKLEWADGANIPLECQCNWSGPTQFGGANFNYSKMVVDFEVLFVNFLALSQDEKVG